MKPVRRREMRPSGAVFIIITVLVILAAWNTGANLLYILFGALASLLILSELIPRRMLTRLSLSREAPERVHRDEPFPVSVRIENRRYFLPTISLGLRRPSESQPLGYTFLLPPRRATVHVVQKTLGVRGLQALPPFVVDSAFPFGLIRHTLAFDDGLSLLVYPKVYPLRTSALELHGASGSTPQLVSGEGDEYFTLREYQAGDSIRHVAWRASARLDKWIVRDHEPEFAHSVILALDSRPGTGEEAEEDFESAVELAASLAVVLINRRFVVSLVTPDSAIPAGSGRAQLLKILEALALLQPTGPEGQDAFAKSMLIQEGPGVAFIFVSANRAAWGKQAYPGDVRVQDPRSAYAHVH